MTDNEVILRTEHLTKRFGRRTAVSDLNLTVHRGDIFGFLGPNGAGKSTTIRMVLSLIKPTEGRVFLFDRDVTRDRTVLGRVGGLVERPDFYLYLSGRRNLEIVGALYGGVPRSRIDEVLELVGLKGRDRDRVKSYSHGMKQRLGIAQALLVQPEFLVLDEPTNGLDPQGMKEVRDLILHLTREKGMTIFLSSHLLHEVELIATRMAVIHLGELVTQGSVSELLSSDSVPVQIFVDRKEEAMEFLKNLEGAGAVEDGIDCIRCVLPDAKLAPVNAALVAAGFPPRAFVPRRSLEDFFLSLTEKAGKGE